MLREGNSDRRAPLSVKNYAKKHPHRMGAWSSDSKTNVVTMGKDDFRSNEQSWIAPADDTLTIEFVGQDGETTVLKQSIPVLAGEVVDGTVLHVRALEAFLRDQIAAAQEQGVLFSVHLKATMMKVSDPIIFGHVIRAFFPSVFERFGADLAAAGLNPNDGLGSILAGLDSVPNGAEIKQAFADGIDAGPELAMVDSDKGITNLHVPSDVIVDASMPAMIRTSGHMWGPDGEEHDTLAVIPDSSYAGIYQAVIEDCRVNGLRPVDHGLGAERRAHGTEGRGVRLARQDLRAAGRRQGPRRHERRRDRHRARRRAGRHLARLPDQGRGDPRLGEARGDPRPGHRLPRRVLARRDPRARREPDRPGAHVPRRPRHRRPADRDPRPRGRHALLARAHPPRRGHHLGHGNVLRDYLTDLFPIMELGTSAKMLSVVPLLGGGGLFETGAGGSAPKHVQQLVEQDYLRWDSLGEFLALAVSFEHLAGVTGNARAKVLADTLDRATGTFLDEDKSPGRKLGSIDNRGSHFYLAKYWADELARQTGDAELAAAFQGLATTLDEQESTIVDELVAVQGKPADIGGYYRPDDAKTSAVMRPSATLNEALAAL